MDNTTSNITSIEGDGFSVQFDGQTGIMMGVYDEVLTAEATASLYVKGAKLAQEVGLDNIRGMVFDFRRVKRFDKKNMATAQRESYRANSRLDMSHIPVALLVETPLQETTVRISAQVTPDQDRKQIVHTLEEASAFIDAWHKKHTARG